MTQHSRIVTDENTPPKGIGAPTKGHNLEESLANESKGRKRKAGDMAPIPSTPPTKPVQHGASAETTIAESLAKLNGVSQVDDAVANFFARQNDLLSAHNNPTDPSAHHVPGGQSAVAGAPSLSTILAAISKVRPSPNPTGAPLSVKIATNPPSQRFTGLHKLDSGLIIDRGSNAYLGPAGYEPGSLDTPREGLNRIIEEAIAAPRQPLPHLLEPLPNGRHPLPSMPIERIREEEDVKDKKDAKGDKDEKDKQDKKHRVMDEKDEKN
ncbi:hypothetical protein NKR19_g1174 [Coniochaeta hoffmannii]|uniref:Uncharacterized protein n=1 Tax=Coniochaeta hoffmannii TaxID=91930 RepID=A0AA38S7Z7_9PEZI|nr:hypothetical protein NKR19_g1174 [Coniochaeta hoffmannii]